MVDSIGNFFGGKYRDIAKGFMTVLKESKFYEEGVLTPEEYVKAGDYLTSKCPTWKWCSNKDGISPVDYLPKNKQFLQTTVPCMERVKTHEQNNKYTEETVEDDWCDTTFEISKNKKKNEIEEIDIDYYSKKNTKIVKNDEDSEFNVKSEIKADDFEVIDVDDDLEQNDNIKRSRTYDVSITYDFYYRVPRLWLVGYSEMGSPLSDDEVKEDIMLEYIDKTVTIEKHPNTNAKSVSIHPCKHSTLLKKMISNFEKAGKTLEVEKSIVLFLKFLSSVVPTINYDFTMDVEF